MDTGPDFELLKDAYAIIDGIPEVSIDLSSLCSARGHSLEHGTICSPAGWLARHPDFQALGLALSSSGDELMFKDTPEARTTAEVMAQVFRLPLQDAEHLFGNRDTYTLGDDSGLSDKRLWQRELRDYLRMNGQLEASPQDMSDIRAPFADHSPPQQPRAL